MHILLHTSQTGDRLRPSDWSYLKCRMDLKAADQSDPDTNMFFYSYGVILGKHLPALCTVSQLNRQHWQVLHEYPLVVKDRKPSSVK